MTFDVDLGKDGVRIPSLTPTELRKALAERSEALHKVFEEAGQDLDHSKVTFQEFKDGIAMSTWIRNIDQELNSLGEKVSELDELDKAKGNADRWKGWADDHGVDPGKFAPTGNDDTKGKQGLVSVGEAFVKSSAYKAAQERQQATFELADVNAKAVLEMKATMTTAAGWAPENLRTGRVVLDAQREVEVLDALMILPTNQAAIVFMEETTFTNNAAERAEEAAYAESALALTEQSETVRSIGTRLPVTDEQLADVDGIRAYIDGRLVFMVRQRLDSQVLVGNGTAPNLEGTLNVTGINTQALGADSRPDAIYKGAKAVRVTGRAQPNVVIIHPNDWEPIRLLKTADGVYIWGSPSEAGPQRIWGLPVIETTAVTEGSAIVGDYARHAALYVRQGVDIQTGFVNDDFADGRVTIRAGMRAAMVHFRPAAFTEVTGL